MVSFLFYHRIVKLPSSDKARLVDDAFIKICHMVNDLSMNVRREAAGLLGSLHLVSPKFLEQTLDKKLMSHLKASLSGKLTPFTGWFETIFAFPAITERVVARLAVIGPSEWRSNVDWLEFCITHGKINKTFAFWQLTSPPPTILAIWFVSINGSHQKVFKNMSKSCQKLIKNFVEWQR